MTAITVRLMPPYDVLVGRGLLAGIGATVAATCAARRLLVVTQPPIAQRYLATVEDSLRRAGLEVTSEVVPDGEAAKAADTLAGLWSAAARVPLERTDAVVALGGGVVGDLAGFAAATYNRGIDVVQVPTTLLAQVDAAVGGKTAIDLPEGKNLVGAFHQPAAVIADLDCLASLPERIRIEGFGEIVKYGLIRDPGILEMIEANLDAARSGDLDLLAELVQRSIAVKAAVVAADVRESGERAYLNLGHTYAHALETLTGYGSFLHGEAVAVGMLVALRIGEAMGLHDATLRERTTAVLAALGLPTAAPALPREDLIAVMGRDKKARAGLRFVLLEALGRPTVLAPDPSALAAAIDAVESA